MPQMIIYLHLSCAHMLYIYVSPLRALSNMDLYVTFSFVEHPTQFSVCITILDRQNGPALTFQSISAYSTYTLGELRELTPAHCHPP